MNWLIAGVMVALLLLYLARYRGHDKTVWSAPAAWSRAAIYFCFCLLAASISGALTATLESPLIYPGQAQDPLWWISTLGVLIFIIVAYWGYWYHNTLRFGRKLDLLPQGAFGLCWGLTTGLYFLAFWHISLRIGGGWPIWGVWLLAYVMISLWQALWMDMYWDVWVSPEHDSPESIRKKVPRTHIPNMTLCLTYFAVYQNYWIFIGLQTLALMAASYGMRMPAPWCRETTPAARQVPGLLGLPRAGGYIGDEQR